MAQKLFIPHVGCLLMLAEPWSFRLYFEYRNMTMLSALGYKPKYRYQDTITGPEDFIDGVPLLPVQYEPEFTPEELAVAYKSYRATNSRENPYFQVELPKDTQLKVDRIYIKNGAVAFNSITFRTTKLCPDKKFKSKRFWVKLRDANEIVADIIG